LLLFASCAASMALRISCMVWPSIGCCNRRPSGPLPSRTARSRVMIFVTESSAERSTLSIRSLGAALHTNRTCHSSASRVLPQKQQACGGFVSLEVRKSVILACMPPYWKLITRYKIRLSLSDFRTGPRFDRGTSSFFNYRTSVLLWGRISSHLIFKLNFGPM
jgi:hypothetical protein